MIHRDLLKEIERSVERLWPAVKAELAGQGPMVQGAILADLTAIWLAGHVVPGDAAATKRLRDKILRAHITGVWDLVPVNEPERRNERG